MCDEIPKVRLRDLRYAARGLWRAPGFAAVSILTLARGIGAITVIYSIVHALVVAPAAIPGRRSAGERVRRGRADRPRTGNVRPRGDALVPRDQSSAFEDVIGTLGQGVRYEAADGVA